MTQQLAVKESNSDWVGARAALEGALAAERHWQSQRESLTEAIAGLQAKEAAVLADVRGDTAARAKRLGEYRISIELLASDLESLESKHVPDLVAWQQTLQATLTAYNAQLSARLDERKRRAFEQFVSSTDPGIMAALKARLAHRSSQTGIEHDIFPDVIAQATNVQELAQTRPSHHLLEKLDRLEVGKLSGEALEAAGPNYSAVPRVSTSGCSPRVFRKPQSDKSRGRRPNSLWGTLLAIAFLQKRASSYGV